MPLEPGSRLGAFEVLGPLGAGGMGEVHRARDPRLDREVAIKVLPDALAQDPERLARFEREAKILASLNHPHIAQLYGIEEADGRRALVLELVEGPTLAERLRRGAVPLDETLRLAGQIAAALEAAHAKGIVHRDLKPANVKLRGDGSVKVLDFGLAKALVPEASDPELSDSPTEAVPADATGRGFVLGTAAYMAPEQARGRGVDARADVWAFGCVLYEMLTTRRPFPGEDAAEIVSAILRAEVDLAALPAETPFLLRRLMRRCLEKDPKRRLRDIGDARMEIEEIAAGGAEAAPLARSDDPRRPAAGPWKLAAAAATLLALAATGLTLRSEPRPEAVVRLPLGVPEGSEVALDEPGGVQLAISGDGSQIAFVAFTEAQRHLYLRRLDEADAHRLPGTAGAEQPCFSPDGAWVAFMADGQLRRVPVGGGAPVSIAPVPAVFGTSWGPDGAIVLGTQQGLQHVPSQGGPLTPVTEVDVARGDRWHAFPQVLPEGRVLYTVRTGNRDDRVEIAPLAGGPAQVVLSGSRAARYSASGHLVYPEAGGLMALPFDLDAVRASGSPALAVRDVFTKSTWGVNNAAFALSANGTLVYQPGALRHHIARLDRNGGVEIEASPRWGYWYSHASPVDGRVATTIAVEASDVDIWVLGAGPPLRVTRDGQNLAPLWTRNGQRLAFVRSSDGNLHWKRPESTEEPELLLDRPGMQWPGSWSEDGKRLAFFEARPDTGQDVRELRLEDGAVVDVVVTSDNESQPDYSPDGRWLLYSSDRSGRREIWVLDRRDGTSRQITTGGATMARWAPDGRGLVYSDGLQLFWIDVSADGVFHGEAAQPLAQGRYLLGVGDGGPPHFTVAPDGRVVATVIEGREREPLVVWNWFAELDSATGDP